MYIFKTLPRLIQTIIWPPIYLGFSVFMHLKIEGIENIKNLSRGVIFTSNHTSELDSILIPASITPFSKLFPVYSVARKKGEYDRGKIKSLLYGGLFFNILGAYPAYSGHKDYKQSLRHHIDILKKGHSVQIFLEGRLSPDGNIQDKARGGIAFLAWYTNTPIVPIYIKGVYKTSIKDFILRKKYCVLVFGAPISPSSLFTQKEKPTVSQVKQVSSQVLYEIKELEKKQHN